jgi:hypothetical protein
MMNPFPLLPVTFEKLGFNNSYLYIYIYKLTVINQNYPQLFIVNCYISGSLLLIISWNNPVITVSWAIIVILASLSPGDPTSDLHVFRVSYGAKGSAVGVTDRPQNTLKTC